VYLLDTDVLIDIQREYAPALTWFATLTELPTVPGLVVMELIQDAQNAHQVRQALRLVAPLPVVWPTAADCQRALTDFMRITSRTIWVCSMPCLRHAQSAYRQRCAPSTSSITGWCPALAWSSPTRGRLSMRCGGSGHPWLSTGPNKALQATAYSARSSLAPASSGG
jgi:hypothetical protein